MRNPIQRTLFEALVIFSLSSAVHSQEPFIPTVKIEGLIQFWNQFSSGQWNETFHYVRLKAKAQVDEQTTALIMPVLGTNSNFTLLDAFVKRDLGNGWLATAGQFKFVFGDDRMLYPDQLKRVDYAKMDKFAFPGNPWDMGFRVEKTLGQLSVRADLIQGAGPNVLKDNDGSKDISARVEWKNEVWAIGGSYYGGTSNTLAGTISVPLFTSYQNWFGAHGRFTSGGFDARAEAIWSPVNCAYTTQMAYTSGDLEPLIYGEMGFVGIAQSYQLLGGGINYWVAPHTRLSLDATLNGATDFSGPTVGILQVEQTF